jgi:uncharacterized Zn finger protein
MPSKIPPPGFPPLTRDHIRTWLGETTLQRGAPYADRAIFDTRRTGRTLKACCQGSADQPYRVEATVGPHGVEHDDCTCLVGGQCKHVAALLLAWLEDPDGFVEVEDVEVALERRDKAELIALIRQMLTRHPELESLLELPLPIAGKRRKPADAALIRREVVGAFQAAGHEWGAAAEAARRLEPLVKIGDDYASLGDWRSAAAIYQTVAQGALEHYGDVQDENGDINAIVNECVSGLGACLQATGDSAQREALLRALFDIYRWDVDWGGIDMGYEAPTIIQSQITPDERRLVASWVRNALPAGDSWSQRYHRQRYGGFLLRLAGDQIDDEEFLRICRETGRRRDLVERLAALGRVDEVEAEARHATDDELLDLADRLREHGHADRAERLVREHEPAPQWQERYIEWRRERVRERGDTAGALALGEELFWRRPTLAHYEELKALAEAHGNWDALRPGALARLERDRQYTLLTQIHLREGEVSRALETVGQATDGFVLGTMPLSIQVAQAAERDHPLAAIELYVAAAHGLIRAHGRESYAVAAGYLRRVRELYARLGKLAAWETLIAGLRDQNRRLRALKEELDRAGL